MYKALFIDLINSATGGCTGQNVLALLVITVFEVSIAALSRVDCHLRVERLRAVGFLYGEVSRE